MRLVPVVLLLVAPSAHALSPEAREFMEITAQLEPVQCEKRKLRREIILADVEKQDASELRKRFSALERDPKVARMEKRLAELKPRVERSSDPEDLRAIDRQRVQAFYRCE